MNAYWESSWPAEDGGEQRLQVPHRVNGPKFSASSKFDVKFREVLAATMVVIREEDEMYLLRHTGGEDAVSWVEKIDPDTLEVLATSAHLPGGPAWPGGIAAHENGSLYVVFGQHAHRLSAQLEVIKTVTLPRVRPYNSFVLLPNGYLVTKDFSGALAGEPIDTPMLPTQLLVLEPEDLTIVATLDLPEPSIARLSARDNDVYVVGTESLLRVQWTGTDLLLDTSFVARYRTMEGQTYGWDPVITHDSAWFLDNGLGSHQFAGTYRGIGVSTAPLHLVRVKLDSGAVTLSDICGASGGIIANPPLIDERRCIAVGYDSGNGVMTAFDYDDDTVTQRWSVKQDHASHMLNFSDTGEFISADFSPGYGTEQVVVRNISTGEEIVRIETDSPIQSVVFPAVSAVGVIYWCSMYCITRIAVRK